jgi:hypothetical protein
MNTETKELLTLAAKAMGYRNPVWHEVGDGLRVELPKGGHEWWNPLTSADDLVEMECQMAVEVIWAEDRCIATAWFVRECFGAHELYSNHHSRNAARAMASLRVVAEIGKQMEGGQP